MEENQVKQQKFPSFPLFSWYTGYTRECIGGVCPIHGQYTGVCSGRVCVFQFSFFSCTRVIHGHVCWACVSYTVHTRACMIGRVSFVFFSSLYTVHTRACVLGVCLIHGPYTGVCVGRVSLCFSLISYTVSVHGRVSHPCVSLAFQNFLFSFL